MNVITGSLEAIHHLRCGRKKPFGQKTAITIAKRLTEESGELLVAYKCFDCGSFHVGHADKSQRIARGME